jgi:hypothetical protein
MKKRAGKSVLAARWHPPRTLKMSDEFLELLWVLEATLATEPELKQALDHAVAVPVSPQPNCLNRSPRSVEPPAR